MTKRLRIGYYLSTPLLGGTENYLRDLLAGADPSRHDIVLITPDWPALHDYLGVSDLPAVRVAIAPTIDAHLRIDTGGASSSAVAGARGRLLHGVRQAAKHLPGRAHVRVAVQSAVRVGTARRNERVLLEALRREHLDLLHVVNGGYPGATSALSAVAVARRAGVPAVVLTVCSTATPRGRPRWFEAALDTAVADASAAVVVPAARPGSALTEHRELPPHLLHTIPWGVRRPRGVLSRVDARARLGLPEDAFVVGVVANLVAGKGHEHVVDAVARLRRDHVDTYLVLVGDGPSREPLRAQITAANLEDRVAMLGHVDDVFAVLPALDAYVLASDIEGLPLGVLEAMSIGLPVVATDVGGMPEAVREGVTGYLVPPRDAVAVAEALRRLSDDSEKRQSFGDAARALYDERFTVEAMLQSTHRLYDEVTRD